MTSIHVQPLFDSATQQQKDAEAQQIAADVARFQAAGGKVEVLGTTPIDRSTISRRQVVEGGHNSRTKKGAQMTHHRYDRRLPKRTEGFAWGRSIDKVLGGHVLTYRLFRRDLAGKLHIETRTFQLNDHRRHIALQLLIARRQLRERVDAIGYALIEAEQATTQLQEVA